MSLAFRLFPSVQLLFVLIVLVWFGVHAAELSGMEIPEVINVNGRSLYLNGFGQRTYSAFGVPIYIASLYLEHLSTDPNEVIRSPEVKLLTVRFEHSVSAEQARSAWREGFQNNCEAPCHLDPEDVETFLAKVSPMVIGDIYSLLFAQNAVVVTLNGERIGTITEQNLAEAMLATFLGPRPASPRLKQELLRGHG